MADFKFIVPTGSAEVFERFQMAPRSKYLTAHLNYRQHDFAFYFTAVNVGVFSLFAHNSSARLMAWTKYKRTPFLALTILTAYHGVQTILPVTSRRAWQCMDRYDRDWKNMPLDW